MRKRIEEGKSRNKNLGGEKKRKDENKKETDSDGGNSNRAVFNVLSDFTNHCR
jgi:hypothetical protein